MAIKLRIPEKGEPRLVWLTGCEITILTDNEPLRGALDFQVEALPTEELEKVLYGEGGEKTYVFMRRTIRKVRGLRDEDGKEYPDDVQLDFVSRANEVLGQLFKHYISYMNNGEPRKKS